MRQLIPLFLLLGCEDPSAKPPAAPAKPHEPSAEERRAIAGRKVRESAKVAGYAFAVCTKPARLGEETNLLDANNTVIELLPTENGSCHQFDGLKPGMPVVYALRPQDNSLVRGLSVCAPRAVPVDDDPSPNPCVPLSRTNADGAYAFVIYPRVADEPIIEIGTVRPGQPLVWPADHTETPDVPNAP